MIYYPGKYESIYPSFSFFKINLTAGITGMNPKANFGNISQQAAVYCTLRFAGLFNLPIPISFAFGIGVSQ
jgi:hypothetical protein